MNLDSSPNRTILPTTYDQESCESQLVLIVATRPTNLWLLSPPPPPRANRLAKVSRMLSLQGSPVTGQ